MGTTTATVIRRIGGLESALGARLFDRTPNGLLPTAALELVLPWAEQVESAAIGLQREVQGHESAPEGKVRLALLPVVASRFVVPAIPALRARYPDIALELVASSAVVDLVRREADIAVRTVRPQVGDLVVQRLGRFPLSVVASPTLLAERNPRCLDDLPWVAWSSTEPQPPEARWQSRHVADAKVVLRASGLETLIEAARAGVGALVVAEPVAAVCQGLVRVNVPIPPMPQGDIWLVAHRALRPVPRVDAVWQWILASFRSMEAEGRLQLSS